MLLSAITPQLPLSPPNSSTNQTLPRGVLHLASTPSPKPPPPPTALPSLKPLSSTSLRHVSTTPSLPDDVESPQPQPSFVSSASAVSSAIRKASTSPVDFTQTIESNDPRNHKLVMPSPDFQCLCLEQLDLFRRVVEPDAILSVYVRPAGSYVMDQLELRRVMSYPGVKANDVVILVGNFTVTTGLRATEASLSSQQVEVI